mmetsp:Transcript_61930/g.125822  ORF Transcript_61930/g.125822 Transcript_61930/m.125822 type:complete len:238 (-) Transcript_61930:1485-2198(-)
MISRISACICVSSSCRCCRISGDSPGRPVAEIRRSLVLVSFRFFTTSTHSNLGSILLGGGAGSNVSSSMVSSFSFSSLASPLPSASLVSSSAFSTFSEVSVSMVFAPFSAGAGGAVSASAVASAGTASGAAPSGASGASGASASGGCPAPLVSLTSSGSGGSSRFSRTISSTSSSSTICAESMVKVPCRVNLALTFTFFFSVCCGSSTRNFPRLRGVMGSSGASSVNSAERSKGSFR